MPVAMREQIRLRTDWSFSDTRASALDHVYAALRMDSDAAERLLLHLLREPPVCIQFIESLSSLNGFDLLDTCLQGKILRLILKNVPFFAAFRLDKVLISFIEKQNSNGSKSITFVLAHEVLLRWTHQQPILDINEASATILLQVFEGSRKKRSSNPMISCDIVSSMMKFNETEDLPHIKRKCLESRHAGNTELHCYDMQAQVAVADSDNAVQSYDSPSEDLIIESLSKTISEEKMSVMRSSLLHTTWLHSMECHLPSSDTSSKKADAIILSTVISDEVPCIEESDPQPASKLKQSGVPNNNRKIEDTSLTPTLIPTTNTPAKKLDKTTGSSLPLIRDAQLPLTTTKEKAVNEQPMIPTGDIHGYVEILLACRAHRSQVLKASAGKGILTPKAIQQLSQSASLLLIKIGNIECLSSISEAMTTSEMTLSYQQTTSESSQSMLYSQSDNNTEESSSVHSLESYLIQSHALLSLNFYCAPDELIAATTDYLLSKIDAQDKLNKWESKEQIRPQSAVLYLIGVLLLRIRTLTLPASRLLFRALETAVKKTPNLAVNLLLPMIVKTVHKLPINLVQESTQPQFEILTRVTRQSLSVEQCNDLVECLCSNAMPTNVSRIVDTASLSATVLAAANVVMLAMFSVHSNEHLLNSTSSSDAKNGQNNRKKTIGSVDHMFDLSIVEQNSHYQRWTASINTHPALYLQHIHTLKDITHVWCESMGYPPEGRTLPDPELLRTIDTILKKITMLNLATAQSLFDLLEAFSDDIISQSTHTVQADIRLNLTTAVISVLYTIVTRFSKTVIEGAMKKHAVNFLGRCGSSTVGKAALTAYMSLP